MTCVDKAIGPQHQKLSWFWKNIYWLRFSWCKVYGERASVSNRRCWWQTTQEKEWRKKRKKNENEEERIGLQKCSLANITKNEVEKEWSSSISLLLLGGVRQRTSSFSLFFVIFSLHFGIVLQWIPPIICLLFLLFIIIFFCFLHLLFGGVRHQTSFLLRGVHQQASSFSSFLHYNEYLLFTFFSPSYSSYFLFFHFLFGGVIILIFLSSIFFTSFFEDKHISSPPILFSFLLFLYLM